jgi:diguanylate cyclase (GGDEF)-like protein
MNSHLQAGMRMSLSDAKLRFRSHGYASLRQLIVRFIQATYLPARELTCYRKLTGSLFACAGSMIPGLLVCSLTAFLCWLETRDQIFAVMTMVVALIGLFRVGLLYGYRRHDPAVDTWKETRRWDLAYMVSATLMSAAMGLNGFFALIHSESPSLHMLVVGVNIASGSTYIARNAARPFFAMMQLVLFSLPFAGLVLLSDKLVYIVLGWLSIVYLMVNVTVVFNIYRNLIESIKAKETSDWLTAELRRQNESLGLTLNTMPHGVAMFDKDMNLRVANDRHYALFRLPRAEKQTFASMQHHLMRTQLLPREAMLSLRNACQASFTRQSETRAEIITHGGSHLVVHFNPSPEAGILMFTEDATARKNAEAEVERLARYDTLTGLPNRHELNLRLAQAFNELRNGGSIFALLYLDLDGFKRINDTLGHASGDALLIEVSKRLKCKIVSQTEFFRLGGDEFAAICLADRDESIGLARSICEAMKEPFVTKSHVSRIGASIGVAFAPEHGTNSEELLRKADIALYRAKAKGRGLAMVYDTAMAEEFTDRIRLEADLTDALTDGSFEFHFQPIVDVESGQVVSYEALARWRHPERGYVPPDVFIPIAEQTGAIHQLGCLAIREACAAAAGLDPAVSICVNVSVLQFRDPKLLLESVQNSLSAYKLEPHRLTLEITESLFIDEFEEAIATIDKIKALGVNFSLDDFGSGYSSLSLLSQLPLSIVKIDQSLTRNVVTSTASYAILEAICALAKSIGLIVVVEGVEKREQHLALRFAGADRAQGWLFGKPEPLPKNELAATSEAA